MLFAIKFCVHTLLSPTSSNTHSLVQANTLSLEENIKLFSAVQKFILNSGRFTYDANN